MKDNIFTYLKLFNLISGLKEHYSAGHLLLQKQKTLSIAESCTGGLISSLMTDVSGSSAYIHSNFVTYANEAKEKYLLVKPDTIEQYGAVSVQTAGEMVKGLLEITGSDYALATTGIAGPTGGSAEKPVGLVYIGVGTKDEMHVHKYNADPKLPRIIIKYLFAKQAIKLLTDVLKEKEN